MFASSPSRVLFILSGFSIATLFLLFHRRSDPMAAVLQPLKFLVVKPRATHTSTIIFMHGLGDTGQGWEPVAKMLAPHFPGTKWILPHARIIPVSINMQMKMSSWFDITSLNDFDNEDEPGMLSAAQAVNAIISAEVDEGIPASKIVVGGFSQGSAMACLTGLTSERKLAGIVSLSGWLPLRKKMKAMMSDHSRNYPVFWGHGRLDQVVAYKLGEMSVQLMKDDLKMKNVTFKSYDMYHESDPEELDDLKEWLKVVLPEE